MASGGSETRRLEVEQLADPFDPGPRLLADGEHTGELSGWCHELGDVRRERQKGAEAQAVMQRQPASEGQHGDLTEQGDGLQQRLVASLQADRPHLCAVQGARGVGDPLQLAPLLAERLDDSHSVDVLVDDLRHVALSLLGIPRSREDALAHAVRHHQQCRHDDQCHGREQRRQIKHDGQRQDHHENVAAHDRQEAQQSLYQSRIRVGTSDELAGRHSVEVREVHLLEVGMHVVAKVVLDRQRDSAAVVAA